LPGKLVAGESDESDQSEVMDESTMSTLTRKGKRNLSDGLIYLGAKDEHFEHYILLASSIRILNDILYLRPEDLPNGNIQDDPSIASRVHLEIGYTTAREISTQFNYYHGRRYDETTFTKLITHYIAPLERYVSLDGLECVMSLWRDKWRPGKDGPPVPAVDGYTSDWDIEPDMTHMVALNLFKGDLRNALRQTRP
jgi:hypothetical protein